MMKISKAGQDENCSLCDRKVLEGQVIIRKIETDKGVCVICLVEIADLKQKRLDN